MGPRLSQAHQYNNALRHEDLSPFSAVDLESSISHLAHRRLGLSRHKHPVAIADWWSVLPSGAAIPLSFAGRCRRLPCGTAARCPLSSPVDNAIPGFRRREFLPSWKGKDLCLQVINFCLPLVRCHLAPFSTVVPSMVFCKIELQSGDFSHRFPFYVVILIHHP